MIRWIVVAYADRVLAQDEDERGQIIGRFASRSRAVAFRDKLRSALPQAVFHYWREQRGFVAYPRRLAFRERFAVRDEWRFMDATPRCKRALQREMVSVLGRSYEPVALRATRLYVGAGPFTATDDGRNRRWLNGEPEWLKMRGHQ